MSKDKEIDEVNKACREIEKRRDNYQMEMLKFFHQVYVIKQKSTDSEKDVRLNEFLDRKVEIITLGYRNKRTTLMGQYVEHLEILLQLKKELLLNTNSDIVCIGNSVAKDIKRLKNEIEALKKELEHANCETGKRR